MKLLSVLVAASLSLSLKKDLSTSVFVGSNLADSLDAPPAFVEAGGSAFVQTRVIEHFTVALGIAARATKVSLKIIAVYKNAEQVPEFVEQLKDLVQATQAFQDVTSKVEGYQLPDYYQRRVLSVTSKLLDSSHRIEAIEKKLADSSVGAHIGRAFSALVQGLGGRSTDKTVDELSSVLSAATDEVRLLVRDLADERVLSGGSDSMLSADTAVEVDAGSRFVTEILTAVAATHVSGDGTLDSLTPSVTAALTENDLTAGSVIARGAVLFQLDRCIDTIETVSAGLGASSTQNKFVSAFRAKGRAAINRLDLLKRWVEHATDRTMKSQEMVQIFVTAHRCYTGLVNTAGTTASQRAEMAVISAEDMEARSSQKALCEHRERMINDLMVKNHLAADDSGIVAARLESVNAPTHCAECQWYQAKMECPVGLVETWSQAGLGFWRYCCRKHQCSVTPEADGTVRLTQHPKCTQYCGQDELPRDSAHGNPGTKFKDLSLTSACPNLAKLDANTWKALLEKFEDFDEAMEAVGLHSVLDVFHNRDGREILTGAWKMMREDVLTHENLEGALRYLSSEQFAEQVAPQLASLGEDAWYEIELLESLHQILTIKRAIISFLDQPAHQRLSIRMERIDSALDFAQSLMVLQRAFELAQVATMRVAHAP
jgi:hypothetical protein